MKELCYTFKLRNVYIYGSSVVKFILFNYLYDIIHIYKPWLTQMVNYALKSEIILVSVNYEKDFRKWEIIHLIKVSC